MIKLDASIDALRVTFLSVQKKLRSTKTKRTYYKVLAEIKTKKGMEKHAYWFGEHNAFLRQKKVLKGKTSIKVECNPKQRAAIQKLVDAFEAKSA